MKYEAKMSFSGPKVSAKHGEIIEITDKVISDDLLKAGYIEAAEKPQKKAVKKNADKRDDSK